MTSTVTLSSTTPSVATVSATGMVTAGVAGTTTITAEATAFNGPVSSSTTLTVSGAGGGATGGNLVSLTIIPSDIEVDNLQDTGQFLAIGTFSNAPFIRDLTNSPTVTWISATPSVFPVSTNTAGSLGVTAGVVTAYGNGSAVTVEAKNPADGSLQTATAKFGCPLVLPTPPIAGSGFPGSQAPSLLAMLTVYNEGLNTTDWDVTDASATGTPNVLHCVPGNPPGTSVCTTTYPFFDSAGKPTQAVLKASGGAFSGWFYNCIPSDASGKPLNPPTITAGRPNYCTLIFDPAPPIYNTNVTVGAIFN